MTENRPEKRGCHPIAPVLAFLHRRRSNTPITTVSPEQVKLGESQETSVLIPIQPNKEKPIFIRPEDILEGKVERGIKGEPADAILILNAAWIAGGGPLTQLTEVAEGITTLSREKKLPIGYCGPQLPNDQLKSMGIPTLSNIPNVTSITERYEAAEESVYHALKTLADTTDATHIGVLSIGYTAYGPRAVKDALLRIKAEEGKDIKASVINFDSAYPDTDNPSDELYANGIPVDRFNPESDVSTDDV